MNPERKQENERGDYIDIIPDAESRTHLERCSPANQAWTVSKE